MKSLVERQQEWDEEYGPNSTKEHKYAVPIRPSEENDEQCEEQFKAANTNTDAFNKRLQVARINEDIQSLKVNTNLISDGYHTFGELYEHRIANFIALCKTTQLLGIYPTWRSRRHSDGELAFGGTWFVVGIGIAKGEQITYHFPIVKWEQCDFLTELPTAPEWDGHTSSDVLERLAKL